MSKKRSAAIVEDSSDDGLGGDGRRSKKNRKSNISSQTDGPSKQHTDDDGNVYWEISRTRRVQISEFKNNTMINIREFYEKDGQMLPGKKVGEALCIYDSSDSIKGISLTMEQFNSVIELLPEVEAVLKKKNISIKRPAYDQSANEAAESADITSDALQNTSRANHEATSDEDD